MAEYNFNDINEAKRRVKEMQSKQKPPAKEETGNSLAALLARLESPRERALVLSVLYLLSAEAPSEALLSLILGILL